MRLVGSNSRPTIEDFIGEKAIFEGFKVDEGTGDIVNPELGVTAFIKSRNEGSDYYKGIFVRASSVETVGIELKDGVELI